MSGNSALQIQQASKQCLFVNAGWYMGSYTADVDLRLGGPRVIFWNEYSGYSFTDMTDRTWRWTAELAGDCYICKQF